MRVVVAYDISNDMSRQKIALLLEAVLTRVQYSVFEGEAPESVISESVRKALPLLDTKTDSIRVYRLCAACAPRVDVYGRSAPLDVEPFRIL